MTVIKHRRGTAAAWTAANPVLAEGEPAYETDTGKQKIGDGVTVWSGLPYVINTTTLSGLVVAEVEDAFEDYVPGTDAMMAEVTTTFTITSAAYPGVTLPGLAVTVVGNGRPIDLECYFPSVMHSVGGTAVSIQLLCDATLGPLNTLVTKQTAATAAKPDPMLVKRRVVVADGVSKTWQAYGYASAAGTTTFTAATFGPIQFTATRR